MTEERPVIVEINCETGEETSRPLTDEEWAEHKKAVLEAEKRRAEMLAADQAREAAKASALAKLAALGLTEEEAKAIAG